MQNSPSSPPQLPQYVCSCSSSLSTLSSIVFEVCPALNLCKYEHLTSANMRI
ncbi:hypothetical protein HanXRQr2_Chr04g0174581 [Helianthus annuus]|uniref:Uncharacterized protein n=1 Tax=Helianthus annuus TaxID=4232 RepID=A0A9K3J8Q5_HELAN|nr:hypothetical protein HanXRQr2_Chr04g0174581 [Helianthus annuus]KAJ0931974.1 hypothetical protein HanPSC8_Chr04g0168221 [Helianthus annuus]